MLSTPTMSKADEQSPAQGSSTESSQAAGVQATADMVANGAGDETSTERTTGTATQTSTSSTALVTPMTTTALRRERARHLRALRPRPRPILPEHRRQAFDTLDGRSLTVNEVQPAQQLSPLQPAPAPDQSMPARNAEPPAQRRRRRRLPLIPFAETLAREWDLQHIHFPVCWNCEHVLPRHPPCYCSQKYVCGVPN